MATPWRDLLLLIQVPLNSGGTEGCTGLPVGQDRILTVRHGLFPDDYNPDGRICIRWFHQPDSTAPPTALPRSAIIWQDKGLDAALICCRLPEKLRAWRYLSPVRPGDNQDFASEGFPIGADSAQAEPQAFPFGGKTNGAASTSQELHLDPRSEFQRHADWGGVSGAPVVVRDQLVGMVVSTPTKAQFRIKALFAGALFAAKGFEGALGYGPDRGRYAALASTIKAKLEDSPDACRHLCLALPCRDDRPASITADLLRIADPQDLVRTLRRAHDTALEEQLVSLAGMLRGLLLTLLPARFDDVAVHTVRDTMAGGEAALIEPGVFTGTAAEMVMAEVDGEPAQLRSPDPDDAWPYPDGVHSVEHPPIEGIGNEVTDAAYLLAWQKHIVNKWASGPGFERAALESRLSVAARRMARGSHNKRTPYVLIEDDAPIPHPDPDSKQDAAADIHARRAALVRETCPSLVFLRLSADGERLEWETALLDPLCRMLAPIQEADP